MRIQELLKEDAREYYDAVDGLVSFCQCDGDKACDACIDDDLYGLVTTTQQDQLPNPPPFIIVKLD